MKSISSCTLTFLLLSVLIPREAEALAAIILANLGKLAVQQGLKLADMSYYAKCSTVDVPPGIKCQSTVFGIGLTEDQAKMTAQTYATMFGDKECGKYVRDCHTVQFNFMTGLPLPLPLPKINLPKIKLPKIPRIGK